MQSKQPVALAREVGEWWGEGGHRACVATRPSPALPSKGLGSGRAISRRETSRKPVNITAITGHVCQHRLCITPSGSVADRTPIGARAEHEQTPVYNEPYRERHHDRRHERKRSRAPR
jgi:hypothetical protein